MAEIFQSKIPVRSTFTSANDAWADGHARQMERFVFDQKQARDQAYAEACVSAAKAAREAEDSRYNATIVKGVRAGVEATAPYFEKLKTEFTKTFEEYWQINQALERDNKTLKLGMSSIASEMRRLFEPDWAEKKAIFLNHIEVREAVLNPHITPAEQMAKLTLTPHPVIRVEQMSLSKDYAHRVLELMGGAYTSAEATDALFIKLAAIAYFSRNAAAFEQGMCVYDANNPEVITGLRLLPTLKDIQGKPDFHQDRPLTAYSLMTKGGYLHTFLNLRSLDYSRPAAIQGDLTALTSLPLKLSKLSDAINADLGKQEKKGFFSRVYNDIKSGTNTSAIKDQLRGELVKIEEYRNAMREVEAALPYFRFEKPGNRLSVALLHAEWQQRLEQITSKVFEQLSRAGVPDAFKMASNWKKEYQMRFVCAYFGFPVSELLTRERYTDTPPTEHYELELQKFYDLVTGRNANPFMCETEAGVKATTFAQDGYEGAEIFDPKNHVWPYGAHLYRNAERTMVRACYQENTPESLAAIELYEKLRDERNERAAKMKG